MRKSSFNYPLLLLVCWTGLIGPGTYVLLKTTAQQHFALKYATTQGLINSSEVGRGSMIRRGVEIEYNYTVNGRKYTGHRFRYDDHNAALEWEVTVEEFPRSSHRKVYYNPENPADSVLQASVNGDDLLLLLFALPLDVMTCTLWRGLISQIWERRRVRRAGGLRILKRPGLTRVWLGETSAIAAGCYAMAAGAFVASFPIVIVAGFQPSLEIMKVTWAVVMAVGAAVFVWRLYRKWSGIYDLRINQTAQTVTLPQTAGRPEPLAISRGEISGVSMQRRVSKGPSGTHFSYLPALQGHRTPTERRSWKLISWGWSEERARAFSQWLSQELGVEFKGVEEEVGPPAAG
jgi:hypothetical protein